MAKKKSAASPPAVETITYLVQRHGGKDQRITVPASWKVTFGPLVPGSKGEYNGKPALRFWETENKQRAVITDVICFRDVSIPIEEKRVSVKQQTLHKNTGQGAKEVIVEGRMEEWVNPDAPQQASPEYFKLEHNPDNEDPMGL